VSTPPKSRVEADRHPEPATEPAPHSGGDPLDPEDFYFEGPYMVFTAAYHLKRGYCCNSDCRHCPYR
jgi:hypothetical protein